MNRLRTFFCISFVLTTFSACVTGEKEPEAAKDQDIAAVNEPTLPATAFYYVVRPCFRRAELTFEEIVWSAESNLIPTVDKMVPLGLRTHMTGFGKPKQNGIPDFIAFYAFESSTQFKELQSEKAPADVARYWSRFDDACDERSKFVAGAQNFDFNSSSAAPDKLYDLLDRPVHWLGGYSSFIFGRRKAGIDAATFRDKLSAYLKFTATKFDLQGMRGYLAYPTKEWIVLFQNWDSEAVYNTAAESGDGKTSVNMARGFMDIISETGARSGIDNLAPGEFVVR